MSMLISATNCSNYIFIFTTNHFESIEVGVRDHCHLIPFNKAPNANWLPLAKRIIQDAGISGVSDQALINVIDQCNGSARQILDAIVDLGLQLYRKNNHSNPV